MTTSLPQRFQPNPLVTDPDYVRQSFGSLPKNNVNTGPYIWCDKVQNLDPPPSEPGPSTESAMNLYTPTMNQRLAGLPNPKTFVPPMIPIPIYNNEVWKANDFMVPRGVNTQRRQELWQNGYMTTPDDALQDAVRRLREGFREDYEVPIPSMSPQTDDTVSGCMQSSDLSGINLTRGVFHDDEGNEGADARVYPQRNYDRPSRMQPPFVDANGYDASNIQYNLPVNYPAGRCEKTPSIADYNKNIFTSTLQPNVYSASQAIDPGSVMQNLGISYTQPFLPTYSSLQTDAVGGKGVVFTQYDPALAPGEMNECRPPINTSISEDQVYDPRLTGYGTAYRVYIDKMTGQPRYFYDDVDAHRQNPFLTRNKLDFEWFGLQSGAQDRDRVSNEDVRKLAQQSYMNNQLQFRTELQARLMRKNNARDWQRKMYPIMTNQYNKGASSGNRSTEPTAYAGPRG